MPLPFSMSEDKKLSVYSKTGCGYCDRLVEFMDDKGIAYQKFQLGEDFTSEDFVTKFGTGTTFPQVVRDYETIGGMKDTVRFLVSNKSV